MACDPSSRLGGLNKPRAMSRVRQCSIPRTEGGGSARRRGDRAAASQVESHLTLLGDVHRKPLVNFPRNMGLRCDSDGGQ